MVDTFSLGVITKTVIRLCICSGRSVIFYSKYCWLISKETEMFRETFRGLTAATGGDPGGLSVAISRLNVWFAICIHSSSVFRKVAHVDFTMLPVSKPILGRHTR